MALALDGTNLLARDAFAQACTVSTDCPKGFVCNPTGIAPNGGTESSCVSGQCQSDSDCGAGFRCIFALGSICMPDADGGQDCQPNNVCAPQWEVPCTANSQCGPGFTCALDGGALPDPASNIAPLGVIDCGPSRFDASVPSYATATWISCSDVPEPPQAPFCNGGGGEALPVDAGPYPPNVSPSPACLPAICEAGTMCLSITGYSCSSPAVYESCQSEADCASTWTCACPVTCGSGVSLAPDAAPVADAGCATVCIPPNADLSPYYGECAGAPRVEARPRRPALRSMPSLPRTPRAEAAGSPRAPPKVGVRRRRVGRPAIP